MLIYSRSDIDEVSIYVELHEGLEPLQGVWHHARFIFDIPLHLEIICVKYYIQLPLFSHIAQVTKRGELHSKWLDRLNV